MHDIRRNSHVYFDHGANGIGYISNSSVHLFCKVPYSEVPELILISAEIFSQME
jgi:hypothetical protein